MIAYTATKARLFFKDTGNLCTCINWIGTSERERDAFEILNLIRRLYNVNQEFLENLFDIFFL